MLSFFDSVLIGGAVAHVEVSFLAEVDALDLVEGQRVGGHDFQNPIGFVEVDEELVFVVKLVLVVKIASKRGVLEVLGIQNKQFTEGMRLSIQFSRGKSELKGLSLEVDLIVLVALSVDFLS